MTQFPEAVITRAQKMRKGNYHVDIGEPRNHNWVVFAFRKSLSLVSPVSRVPVPYESTLKKIMHYSNFTMLLKRLQTP